MQFADAAGQRLIHEHDVLPDRVERIIAWAAKAGYRIVYDDRKDKGDAA